MKKQRESATRTGSASTMIAAAVLATLLLALAAMLAKPAGATFPGNNGKIAFASNRTTGEGVTNPEGDFEIFTVDPDGTDLVQLTKNDASDFDPEWSPDGEKLAFQSDRSSFSNIFVMNADGTSQTNITNDQSFDRSPSFSPGGNKVAFDSNIEEGKGVQNPTGDFEIFTVKIDGTDLTQLTENKAADFEPDYAPSGKKLAFVSRRAFAPGIYTMKSDGTREKKVSRGPGEVFQSPSFSPDGARIAFASDEDGPLNIYTMRAEGTRQVALTRNGAQTVGGPVFSPDGKMISFHTNTDGNFEVYKARADGTGPVNVTEDPASDFTPDWQPLASLR